MPMQTRLHTLPTSRLLLAIVTLATATGCPGGSADDGESEGPSNATSATGGHGNSSSPSRATGGATSRDTNVGTATGGSVVTGPTNTGGVALSTDSRAGNAQGGVDGASVGRSDGSTAISTTLGGAAMQSRTSGSGGKIANWTATGGKTNRDATVGGKSGNGTAIGGSTALGGSTAPGSAALGGSTGGTQGMGTTLHLGGTPSSTGNTSSKAGSSGSELLVPESGALLGLYYGDASIAATATKLGCNVPMHLTYYAWTDDWTQDNTADDLRAGRIPFVNWELFGAVLDDIIAGKNDTMIKQRAVAAKNLGKKLFLDFGAEMNGDWSPWSGAENGKSADKYVAAYRHVHDLFVQNGATNVIWAFCPNVTSEPLESWNEPLDYYPGDTYVDWMCVDGYNWGKSESGGRWQSFRDVFANIYPTLASKNKPIIIGEMASTELGGNKGEWISQIIPTLKSDFPLIKGLVWFDINKETDWRISSSSASEAAFKTMANDPWFKR